MKVTKITNGKRTIYRKENFFERVWRIVKADEGWQTICLMYGVLIVFFIGFWDAIF